MDKVELKIKLGEKYSLFIEFILALTDEEFLTSKNYKWTAGQQAEHIYLSIKPLRKILALPKSVLKLLWGKSNRDGKNYDDLVKKYLSKLENGGRATKRFMPATVSVEKGKNIKVKLTFEVIKLCSRIEKFTEQELDQYILPHPLLGKLTLREMLFFTIYHIEHHHNNAKQNLIK